MDKHEDSETRFGKEDKAWHREEIVSKAREFRQVGGSAARRELVKTTLELDRLLREAPL